MITIQEEIKESLEALNIFGVPIEWGIINITGFKPVKVVQEDQTIFVTDEPSFIEALKEMGISGKRRSKRKQRQMEFICRQKEYR